MAQGFLILGGLLVWSYLGLRVMDGDDDHTLTAAELFMGGPVVWLCWAIAWVSKIRVEIRKGK